MFREAVLAFLGIQEKAGEKQPKKCRYPDICAMCTKSCSERIING